MSTRLRVLVSVGLFAGLFLPRVGAQCIGTRLTGPTLPSSLPLAGSPYCVVPYPHVPTVRVQITTVAAGVVIKVANNVRLNVVNKITAVGTATKPIVFAAINPTIGWSGLHFKGPGPTGTFRFCRIEGSNSRGLNITNCTPTISDCDIQWNWSGGWGGGMMISLSTGNYSLTNCTIQNNKARDVGAGILVSLGTGSFTLKRCRILNNSTNSNACGTPSTVGGAGIHCSSAPKGMILENCMIASNSSIVGFHNASCNGTALGGGVFVSNSPLTLLNCVVRSNQLSSRGGPTAQGGGIYFAGSTKPLSMTNCIVACNQLTAGRRREGAGIYVASGPSTIVNCTIARNGNPGGGIWLQSGTSTITSSIVYNNSNPQIGGPAAGTATVSYSDVQGGFKGPGNKNVNPAFTGAGCLCQDLAIFPGSLVQNMGNPAPSANDKCFPPSLGDPRKPGKDIRNDMGATGGPGACGWRQWINWANPKLQLSAVPPKLPQLPGTVTFTTRGGVVSMPIGLFLAGINGRLFPDPKYPWVPWWGIWFPVPHVIYCPAGDWVWSVPFPPLPGVRTLSFRTISLPLSGFPPLISNTIKI